MHQLIENSFFDQLTHNFVRAIARKWKRPFQLKSGEKYRMLHGRKIAYFPPLYLNILFLTNLLITFRHYYYAKYTFLEPLIFRIFSFIFLLCREILEFLSNQTFGWKYTCHKFCSFIFEFLPKTKQIRLIIFVSTKEIYSIILQSTTNQDSWPHTSTASI